MKILVVFTGGTIGSSENDGYISTDRKKQNQLIQQYRDMHDEKVEFQTVEAYFILSENLTGDSIKNLSGCIKDNLKGGYDGCIIVHGTDTIQYMSAALSYILGKIDLPVMIVSSNYILEDARANGLCNFAGAVKFIQNKAGKGVFVVYRNSDDVVYVHYGTRLLPHQAYSDDLYSVLGKIYGYYQDDVWHLCDKEKAKQESAALSLECPNSWNSPVLRIIPYPGMEYPEISNHIHAIILETYHSGTLCSVTPGMEDFFENAYRKNIPVFLTGAYREVEYESVKKWKSMKVIVLPAASPVSMYMKLWLAMESHALLEKYTLKNIMETCLADEFS